VVVKVEKPVNELCAQCIHDCKQEEWVKVVECPKYTPKNDPRLELIDIKR
jgi:hypothetical protein